MAQQLYTNNAASTLATGIIATDLTLTVAAGDGAKFPSPTGGDYFLATLTQGSGSETSWEIVQVTARSVDTFTIVRAQEGTTAAIWASGSKVELRLTAASIAAGGRNAATLGASSTIAASVNSPLTWTITNSSNGASANARFAAVNDLGYQASLTSYGSGASNTVFGQALASGTLLNATGPAGLFLGSSSASRPIYFGSSTTLYGKFDTSGNFVQNISTDCTGANTGASQNPGGAWVGKTLQVDGRVNVQGGLQLKRTTISNADSSGAATDVLVVQTGSMTAPHTWTLPAASAFKPGQICWFADESGTVSATNTWTVQRAGADTVEGGTSIALYEPYGAFALQSDGVSKWTRVASSKDYTVPNAGVYTEISTPSAPATGYVDLYAKSFAGRGTMCALDVNGVEDPLGANKAHKGWLTVRPNGANGGFSSLGIATAASAAASTTPVFATTNLQTSMLASALATSTTTNASAYLIYTASGSPWWWRGNAAGLGGMYVVHRFSQNVNTTGARLFVGMASGLPLSASQDPSNTTGANKLIGVGYDSGDANTANWQIYHSDGTTCIRVDTGIQRNATDVLELIIYCAPNDTGFTVLFRNLSTGAVFAPAKYTTNIPANTQQLGPIQWINSGSVSGTAQKLLFYSWDLETP